ncbi:MAG TPA: hypothetical protein VKA49_07515 [Flavitalea sp.]|nr:hypothetical protein [Flavitalea sp.]
MKVLFLSGCLEPGQDGVGDYVRRLATEMIHQGHETVAIAINDGFVSDANLILEEIDQHHLPVYRIPARWLEIAKKRKIRSWVLEFNPDVISIQFVSYSFHKRGLPFQVIRQLREVSKGYKAHIMFHELWIGMEVNASLKEVLIGRMQKFLIRRFIKTLEPVLIHTHTDLYKNQLAKMGVKVDSLPLFGNIPLSAHARPNRQIKSKIPSKIDLVLFGGIHPSLLVDDFTREVASVSKKSNIKIHLQLVGRSGGEMRNWVSSWQALGLTVDIIGEQPAEYISEILFNSSMGITTTPVALLQKSGSVAAMLEHGLPVICIRESWKSKGYQQTDVSPGIIEYQKGQFEQYLLIKTFSSKSRLPEVSNQLTGTLSDILI